MTTRLVAATLRDLSYIASNLRPDDLEEINCQFAEWSPAWLASVSLAGMAYCVEVNGNPEAAVGAMPTTHKGLWVAWSWGTKRMWRAVPIITEFVREQLIPDIIDQGGWRCEARALANHSGAHRWLKRMGATERCVLPCWGRNGEDFTLYDWIRPDVLCRPALSETAVCSGDSAAAGCTNGG